LGTSVGWMTTVGEERGVWNHRWTKQERKTEQRVDGRHQGMVSVRRANTRHYGAGLFGVETICHGGIGHQRAQAHGMKKKKKKTLSETAHHYKKPWSYGVYCDKL